jgi:hypothetical protein
VVQPEHDEREGDASVIPEPVRELVGRSEPAEVVIGVLTYNDKTTAPALSRALTKGFGQYAPDRPALLVNCDAGSQDGTPGLMEQAVGSESRFWIIRHPVHGASFHIMSESGVPGREAAVRLLAMISDRLEAKACLVVDGNLKSADLRWSEWLAGPILDKGADCVLPHFARNRYEGTLTNTLLAPLTRALYGKRLSYHLGGAFALSNRFIRSTLLPQPWDEEIAQYGIDGWLATLASAEAVDVHQALLGPRVHQGKQTVDLATILSQAVGCIFHLMERYQERWEPVKGSVDVPTVGIPAGLVDHVGTLRVERMVQGFRQGLRDLVPVWQIVLSAETFQRVLELGVEDVESFRFPSSLWVQVVYDLALAYHDQVLHREHLLKSLTPLYLGYTASLVLSTRGNPVKSVEQELERLAMQYEAMKPYLIQRWRWSHE